ncbi:MAG: hypothetical protein CM1200mP41_01460 [Gammaproteobacteria bacterium]|nr:MAG: hypothetical protein CM1200mP41_01460 [Gammaproteobacteria bacterium]
MDTPRCCLAPRNIYPLTPVLTAQCFSSLNPAEEGGHGAKGNDGRGSIRSFPCESVFGMHNMPGFEAGTFAVRKPPLMASADSAHVTVQGVGATVLFLTYVGIQCSLQLALSMPGIRLSVDASTHWTLLSLASPSSKQALRLT